MVAVLVMVVVVEMVVRNPFFVGLRTVISPFFVGLRTNFFLFYYFCEGFWLPYFSCTEFLRRFLRPLVGAR